MVPASLLGTVAGLPKRGPFLGVVGPASDRAQDLAGLHLVVVQEERVLLGVLDVVLCAVGARGV